MTAMNIRLPDDKYRRLKELAARRGTSVNRLIGQMTTQMLVGFDIESRFALRAARGAWRGQGSARD